MQLLSFDFGMKHIGVAVGQTLTHTATPLTTLRASDGIPNWTEIDKLLNNWTPTGIVVGIPLNMDDSEQLLTHCARKFAKRLHHHTNLPIYTVDERLSTWEAKNRLKPNLHSKQTKKSKHIHDINAMAAAILLEQWFQENKNPHSTT
jgi:putative Holliday junction resolvase